MESQTLLIFKYQQEIIRNTRNRHDDEKKQFMDDFKSYKLQQAKAMNNLSKTFIEQLKRVATSNNIQLNIPLFDMQSLEAFQVLQNSMQEQQYEIQKLNFQQQMLKQENMMYQQAMSCKSSEFKNFFLTEMRPQLLNQIKVDAAQSTEVIQDLTNQHLTQKLIEIQSMLYLKQQECQEQRLKSNNFEVRAFTAEKKCVAAMQEIQELQQTLQVFNTKANEKRQILKQDYQKLYKEYDEVLQLNALLTQQLAQTHDACNDMRKQLESIDQTYISKYNDLLSQNRSYLQGRYEGQIVELSEKTKELLHQFGVFSRCMMGHESVNVELRALLVNMLHKKGFMRTVIIRELYSEYEPLVNAFNVKITDLTKVIEKLEREQRMQRQQLSIMEETCKIYQDQKNKDERAIKRNQLEIITINNLYARYYNHNQVLQRKLAQEIQHNQINMQETRIEEEKYEILDEEYRQSVAKYQSIISSLQVVLFNIKSRHKGMNLEDYYKISDSYQCSKEQVVQFMDTMHNMSLQSEIINKQNEQMLKKFGDEGPSMFDFYQKSKTSESKTINDLQQELSMMKSTMSELSKPKSVLTIKSLYPQKEGYRQQGSKLGQMKSGHQNLPNNLESNINMESVVNQMTVQQQISVNTNVKETMALGKQQVRNNPESISEDFQNSQDYQQDQILPNHQIETEDEMSIEDENLKEILSRRINVVSSKRYSNENPKVPDQNQQTIHQAPKQENVTYHEKAIQVGLQVTFGVAKEKLEKRQKRTKEIEKVMDAIKVISLKKEAQRQMQKSQCQSMDDSSFDIENYSAFLNVQNSSTIHLANAFSDNSKKGNSSNELDLNSILYPQETPFPQQHSGLQQATGIEEELRELVGCVDQGTDMGLVPSLQTMQTISYELIEYAEQKKQGIFSDAETMTEFIDFQSSASQTDRTEHKVQFTQIQPPIQHNKCVVTNLMLGYTTSIDAYVETLQQQNERLNSQLQLYTSSFEMNRQEILSWRLSKLSLQQNYALLLDQVKINPLVTINSFKYQIDQLVNKAVHESEMKIFSTLKDQVESMEHAYTIFSDIKKLLHPTILQFNFLPFYYKIEQLNSKIQCLQKKMELIKFQKAENADKYKKLIKILSDYQNGKNPEMFKDFCFDSLVGALLVYAGEAPVGYQLDVPKICPNCQYQLISNQSQDKGFKNGNNTSNQSFERSASLINTSKIQNSSFISNIDHQSIDQLQLMKLIETSANPEVARANLLLQNPEQLSIQDVNYANINILRKPVYQRKYVKSVTTGRGSLADNQSSQPLSTSIVSQSTGSRYQQFRRNNQQSLQDDFREIRPKSIGGRRVTKVYQDSSKVNKYEDMSETNPQQNIDDQAPLIQLNQECYLSVKQQPGTTQKQVVTNQLQMQNGITLNVSGTQNFQQDQQQCNEYPSQQQLPQNPISSQQNIKQITQQNLPNREPSLPHRQITASQRVQNSANIPQLVINMPAPNANYSKQTNKLDQHLQNKQFQVNSSFNYVAVLDALQADNAELHERIVGQMSQIEQDVVHQIMRLLELQTQDKDQILLQLQNQHQAYQQRVETLEKSQQEHATQSIQLIKQLEDATESNRSLHLQLSLLMQNQEASEQKMSKTFADLTKLSGQNGQLQEMIQQMQHAYKENTDTLKQRMIHDIRELDFRSKNQCPENCPAEKALDFMFGQRQYPSNFSGMIFRYSTESDLHNLSPSLTVEGQDALVSK